MSKVTKKTPESMIKDIRKNTRRIFSSEQMVLTVMAGLRAEDSGRDIDLLHYTLVAVFAYNTTFGIDGKYATFHI